MTINANSKVVFSLRDYVVGVCSLIAVIGGGIVYVERRVGAIEAKNEHQDVVLNEAVSAAQADRTKTETAFKELSSTVTELRVVAAEFRAILNERKTTK